MNSILIGALTSIGLGALTVIHPCPLGTNIAAVSLLLGWEQKIKRKTAIVLVFVLGEIFTFAGLAILLSFGMLNVPVFANFLQDYMRQLFGPLLIIVGMMLTGILLPKQRTLGLAERFLKGNAKYGMSGSFFLGILIALSFCPMSAAIFFGVLIPLAISSKTIILYPMFFGLGSSLPLLAIVVVVSRSASLFDRSFLMKKSIEKALTNLVGVMMILLGIFMSLRFIFKIV